MCGIYITKKVKSATALYEHQKYRGSSGFGIVTVDFNRNYKLIRETIERDFIKRLAEIKEDKTLDLVMVHHRFPTSTSNRLSQTHPIRVADDCFRYEYLVIHNGVISNTVSLKNKHYDEGLVYDTLIRTRTIEESNEGVFKSDEEDWNDSNSIAIEMVKLIEGKVNDLSQVTGSYALMAFQIDRTSQRVVGLYMARNSGNPIVTTKSRVNYGSTTGDKILEAGVLFRINMETMKESKVCRFTDNYTIPKSYGYNTGGYSPTYNYGKGYSRNLYEDEEIESPKQSHLEWEDNKKALDDLYSEYDDTIDDISTLIDEGVIPKEAGEKLISEMENTTYSVENLLRFQEKATELMKDNF